MQLERGQEVILVNYNGTHKAWVYWRNNGRFLGEIENIPQDLSVPTGTARKFMETEAAKYGLTA